LRSEFFKMEGWDPNYIKIQNGLKVSRVTLIGTILTQNDFNVDIDDGTGIISVRSFDKFLPFETINIGDFVLIIGKIRQFNNEIYISPETCKKIDKKYISFHKNNVSLIKKYLNDGLIKQIEKNINIDVENNEEEENNNKNNPIENILNYIDKKDSGLGVHRQEILTHFENIEIGKLLEKLINDGDIFEITSDVYKVLK
jgi:RPA family protein